MAKLTEEQSVICQRCKHGLSCVTTWDDKGFRRCSQCALPYYTYNPDNIIERDEACVPNSCPKAPALDIHEPLCDVCVREKFRLHDMEYIPREES